MGRGFAAATLAEKSSRRRAALQDGTGGLVGQLQAQRRRRGGPLRAAENKRAIDAALRAPGAQVLLKCRDVGFCDVLLHLADVADDLFDRRAGVFGQHHV